MGCKAEQLVGRNVRAYMSNKDVLLLPEMISGLWTSGRAIFDVKVLVSDHSEKYAEVSCRILQDGSILGLVHDITERKRQEDALSLAYEELNQILNTAIDGLRVVDKGFNILNCNEPFAHLVRMEKKDIIGKKCFQVLYGPACHTLECPLRRVFLYQQPIDGEVGKFRLDGSSVACILRSVPLRSRDGRVIGMVQNFKDISNIKRYENELLEYQERLRSLVSQLTIAEEEQRREIATHLHDDTCQSMALSIMQLRRVMSRIEDEKLVLQMKNVVDLLEKTMQGARSLTFDISPPVLYQFGLVEAARRLFRKIQVDIGINAEFAADESTLDLPQQHQIMLYHMLRELLYNVAKYASANSVKASIQKEAENTILEVCDDGVGFDPESALKPKDNKGFGLFSIRERLKAVGGEMQIFSGEGKGTRVKIVLGSAIR